MLSAKRHAMLELSVPLALLVSLLLLAAGRFLLLPYNLVLSFLICASFGWGMIGMVALLASMISKRLKKSQDNSKWAGICLVSSVVLSTLVIVLLFNSMVS